MSLYKKKCLFKIYYFVFTLMVLNLDHLLVYFLVYLHVDNRINYDVMNNYQLHDQNHHNRVLDISILVNEIVIDVNDPNVYIPNYIEKQLNFICKQNKK